MRMRLQWGYLLVRYVLHLRPRPGGSMTCAFSHRWKVSCAISNNSLPSCSFTRHESQFHAFYLLFARIVRIGTLSGSVRSDVWTSLLAHPPTSALSHIEPEGAWCSGATTRQRGAA